MGALQRVAHDLDVAGAVERVIRAADFVEGRLGHVDDVLDDGAVDFLGVDEMGHPEPLAPSFAVVVDVDADDHIGPGHFEALNDVQTNAAQTKDHGLGALFHLCGVQDGTDAGGHATADVADLVERRVVADLGQRDFGHHGVLGEGGAAHVVIDRRAIQHGEPGGAIGHQALALGCANGGAEVGLARQARGAFAAFGGVKRDHVIAGLQRFHAGAAFHHHARAFMAKDRGENPLGVGAGQGEFVGVANAGGLDLDQNLALFRVVKVHLHDFKRFASGNGNGGTGAHFGIPPLIKGLRLCQNVWNCNSGNDI